MTDIYKPPKSNLEIEVLIPEAPKLVYLIVLLFVLEAISVIAVNLAGAYGIEPIGVYSIEMLIVIIASILILWMVWNMSRKGNKSFSSLIYIFMGISLVFDGPNLISVGVFISIPEFLTLVNFFLLLMALYLVRFRLNQWFVR
ncbi:MAG: hypothetical protein KZQ90_16845 [Candidatus Thiodiazotropha sp. (ex Codakia rugifera)]|nr:hypothetical protein [Candidatus Thiodiazotropha sp. (ex Codakia rugifera)]